LPSDFTLTSPVGQQHYLTLKHVGEPLTNVEENFQYECIRTGTPYAVVHSFDEAMIAFDAWGCLTGNGATP
jgi:hypothetical protein